MKTFRLSLWVKSYSLTMEKLKLRTKRTELLALVIQLTVLDIGKKHSFVFPVFSFFFFFWLRILKIKFNLSCFPEENTLSEIFKVLNYTYLSLILVEKCIGLMDDIILANLNLVCNMGKFVDSIVKSYY